jgi:uncharacterized protein YyaL (SSP411 family)
MREMQSDEGGYFSTLDADSEGREGKFYVWARAEVEALLTPDEYALFAPVYGLDREPNFEGKWHLHTYRTVEDVAKAQDLAPERAASLMESARAKLFAARGKRERPGRDEKILTAWNALMIKGMARAARVLGRDAYLESAERALRFVRQTLWRDGRLLATCKDGRAHLNAYLDDYAFLVDALLELLQTRFRPEDLDFARELAEVLLDQFHDAEEGGFYFTGRDHEALIHRPKPLADESIPAGNGIAAHALQRLGHLVGDVRLIEAAQGTLALAAEPMGRVPYAHASLLAALDEHLNPTETLILRGEGEDLARWQAAAQRRFAPRRLVIAIPAAEQDLPGTLGSMVPGQETRLYRCAGTRCEPPVEGAALAEALGAGVANTP